MSRWSRMVAPLAVALLAVVGGGAAASASSPDTNPPPGLPMYLALGDSIANGQQSAPLVKDYWTTVAGWRANGYVAQFRTDLVRDLNCLPARSDNARQGCRQLQLVNLARSGVPPMDGQPGKPGVTTQIVIDEQLPTATATLQARNHDANPRNDVEVVTIDVGGNDIFGPITSACLGESTAGCQAAVLGAFQAFAANYATILHELREAAGPDTVIITMTYYNPLPYCYIGANPAAGPFGDWVLEGGTLPGVGTLPTGLNDIIGAISQQNGARVADTFGKLGAGDFVGGADCLHPNLSGHTKIAAVLDQAFTS
ncbi:GDSL-like lipase/acylhydrolase family protein [Humibacillus xanthopallidus]|uniref:GDSL-like lipase/acylhydrolase family protein n=1 Tax=Humibacillus xanthopallidus TaxID=412689 RepID=A0A543PLX2_9MICO|nr:SGNH/GDSL hydrolase family protein [Humibacillus xanthopallidus]TQN45059.1 GDSL-like lipase/acylhydrolase family protein [Humibacillus xanthopallidus]